MNRLEVQRRIARSLNRQFPAPAVAAHQQQVGDVGAGNQQNERDGDESAIIVRRTSPITTSAKG